MEAEIQRANRRALRVEKGRKWKQKMILRTLQVTKGRPFSCLCRLSCSGSPGHVDT